MSASAADAAVASGVPSLQSTTGPHPGHAPREWYTSEALLERERRDVFDHSWALVASTDQLSRPGDYVTARVGTSLLLLICDSVGTVRAFHNMCRHRGAPLLDGSGTCGRYVTCPYHQWTFEIDGRLRRVPQAEEQFPGLDLAAWGLLPAQAAVWHGMVFANSDPSAPGLEHALGFLGARLDRVLSGPLVEVARVEYTAECNWKLLVENHIDVYHLWYLHSRTLSMYDHRRFEWAFDTGNWWSLEPLRDPADADGAALGWLDPPELHGIGAHLLFPNLMVAVTGEYFATYDATPLDPGRTRLVLRIRSVEGAAADRLVASVRSFLAEDVEMCEQLQQAAGSSSFAVGPLASGHEAPIRAFHAALAARCGWR